MLKTFRNILPAGIFFLLPFFIVLLCNSFTGKTGSDTISQFFPQSAVYAQEEGGDAAPAPAANNNAADDEEGSAASNEPAPKGESYLVWFIGALGPVFAPLFAITSVIFVALAVMNWMSISRNQVMPQSFIDKFKEKLEASEFQEAYEVAKENDSQQAKILAAGLAKMQSGYEAAQQAMSDVAEEEIMNMEQKLGYLSLIAGIAPMLGLLGTVVGMVQSFQVIATSGTAPEASELAKGISTALITTEVGLFIAIPAMVIYEILRNKLAHIILELTVQTENLMARFNTK
jgi:biopolymer transport protein ExbB